MTKDVTPSKLLQCADFALPNEHLAHNKAKEKAVINFTRAESKLVRLGHRFQRRLLKQLDKKHETHYLPLLAAVRPLEDCLARLRGQEKIKGRL